MAQQSTHVVLVRFGSPNLNIITPPLGIGYLLKALGSVSGITPVFFDCKLDAISDDDLVQRLVDLNPLLVGFQVFSVDYVRMARLVPRLRQRLPAVVLVAGGPHPSGLPEYTLAHNPALDYVVAGEGEEALPLLVRHHLGHPDVADVATIPNLVHRAGGACVRTAARQTDVDACGAPAWELLRPDRYPPVQHGTFHKSKRVVPILTSRGCPYPCTFCAGYLVTGKKIRLRNPVCVVDEIEWLQNTYGFEEFIIEDENFTYYKSHVIAFADEIARRKISCWFSFPNGIRLDRIDEEIVERMVTMGTYTVLLGIESGSLETLGKMGKNWSLDLVRERVRLLKRHGLIVNGSFILGYRDETMADIEQTIAFALDLPLDMVYFGNYLPLPGSPDFNLLVERGDIALDQIQWEHYNSYVGVLPYHPRAVTEAALRAAVKRATMRFYLRPRIILGMLRRMTSLVFVKSFLIRLRGIFFDHTS